MALTFLMAGLAGLAASRAMTKYVGNARLCVRGAKSQSNGEGAATASRQAVETRRKVVWKLLGLLMLDGWESADNEMLSDLNGLLQGREINGDAWHGEFQKVVKRYLKKDRQIDF